MSKISVLVPAYEAHHYNIDTVYDRLALSFSTAGNPEVEMVITDDGSSPEGWDALKHVVQQLKDQGYEVALFRADMNKGVAMTLNACARNATGSYFIVQSLRSWYTPGSLGTMAKALDELPEIGFVYGCTRYYGKENRLWKPPVFRASDFDRMFVSLFGYMYRREAWDEGSRYLPYIHREGRFIDISDYDFCMSLIKDRHYQGLALSNTHTLNYYYEGEGQMTHLVHRYQRDIDNIFKARWLNDD